MRPRISASMMCADQLNLARDIAELERAGVDYLHLDVMDGNYVPNIALGIGACNAIKRSTSKPVDVHLLVIRPEDYLKRIEFSEGDTVSAHLEAINDLPGFSKSVRERGANVGVVLNRGIDVEAVVPHLGQIDCVSLMMIEPGFAGLKLLDGSIEKIGRLRDMLEAHGFAHLPIEVDGNVSFEHAPKMRAMGADVFVAGTSSVFSEPGQITRCLDRLKGAIDMAATEQDALSADESLEVTR